MERNIPRAAIHVGTDKKSFSSQVGNEAERRGWDEKRSTKERKRAGAIKEQRIATNRLHHLCCLSVRVERIIIKRGIPIIASKGYIAASQYIFAVSHKEALCIKTNGCTFAA